MRVVAVLLGTLLAGCAADEPPAAGTPAQAPTEAAAFEPINITHDFTEGVASIEFEIPADAGELRLRVWQHTRDRAACAAVNSRVVVFTPDGEPFAEATTEGRDVIILPTGACVEGEEVVGVLEAGTWRADFDGAGLTLGRVVVERS